ncbi:MAG: hypothetical protein R3C14_10205 [Caldilineaceae bacterium]
MTEGPLPLNRDTYLPFVLHTIWTELPRFLWGAFLFNLCCAPAFVLFSLGFLAPTLLVGLLLMAPAWAALQADQLNLLQGANRPYAYFGQMFVYYGRRALQLGLLLILPLLAIRLTLPALAQNAVPNALWLWVGILFFILAVSTALSLYTFSLLVYFDHDVLTTLRNGWILTVRHPLHTVGLLGMAILFGFGVVYLSLGLLLLLPAFYSILLVANCLLVLAVNSDKITLS